MAITTKAAAEQTDDANAVLAAALLAAIKATLAAVENRDAADALLYAQAYRTLTGN